MADADILKKYGIELPMGGLSESDRQIFSKYNVSSPLQTIKEHPFKSLLQPVAKTLGGKAPSEVIYEKYGGKEGGGERYLPAFFRAFGAGVAGDVADIATTPASYIPVPLGKILGKIPVKGTTLGQIAKTIPVGRGFVQGAKELGRYEQTLKAISPLSSRGIPTDPVNKVIMALKEVKPLRKEQEALYSAERGKRVAQVIEAGKIGGEEGYYKQLAALKGQLPKVQLESIRQFITPDDLNQLFNKVEESSILQPLEKVTAKTGLAKLMGVQGGSIPTEGEIKLLSNVFPKEFVDTILSKRPLLQRIGETTAEVLNIPRALMASVDLSAPLRQGVFLVGRPKQFLPAFKDMFKYFFNEKAYQGLMKDIANRPTYALMKESKLPLTQIGSPLTGREEAFMSNLAERIPVVGRAVRASDRAYTGFLNKLRADVFDDLVKSAGKMGVEVNDSVAKNISKFVGAATGRGQLPRALENSAVALNSVFFSPRLMASRLNLMNPKFYTNLDPFTRKEALKSLLTFGSTALSILSLAKMGGASIGIDPRSADFGKIKAGDTRYDIFGGFQQYARLAAQILTGEHISSTTGVKTTIGEGYRAPTRLDILSRFLESKEAPIASFVTTLLKGKTQFGEKVKIPQEVMDRFTPMVIQDVRDLINERGLEGTGLAIPGVFGVGVQTYSPTARDMVYSANSVLNNYKELIKKGRIKEASDILNKNRETIQMGKSLEPLQSVINNYEKLKEQIKNNTIIPKLQKKQMISSYDSQIKDLTQKIEEQFKQLKIK